MKKHGGGSHNWGTEADEKAGAADGAAAATDSSEAAAAAGGEEGAEGGAATAEAAAPAEEEEVDNSITLEEFQAKLKAEREAAAEKFGAVSEKTVDASEFSGGRVRNKKDEVGEDFLVAAASARGEAKKAAKGKGQRSSTKQAFVDVGFRAPAIERGEGGGGRGRGGRGADREGGGGRGGRGRGRGSGDDRPQRAPRQYNNQRGGGGHGGAAEQHVDVNDESSFPKL